MSNGRFVKALGLGRFIKAEAAKWPAQSVYHHPSQAPKASLMAVLSRPGPMAVLSGAWFYQGRSSGLQIPYYPAQSVYQRPGQAIFSKSRSNSSFIKARSNGRFIKAFAVLSRQKQPSDHIQISAADCKFHIILHNQFISGGAKPFSAEASRMAVLSRPVKAWP